MEADWSVELGEDDPVLEMPWASPDGTLRWQDLRQHPELVPQLTECRAFPELLEPLRLLNSPDSRIVTAKCDAYTPESTELAEELFGTWRLVSYIDFVFAGASAEITNSGDFWPVAANFDFARHEQFARDLCVLLEQESELTKPNAAVEFVIRRCVYNRSPQSCDSRDGLYFTVYVIGYGETAKAARDQWGVALRVCGKLLVHMR